MSTKEGRIKHPADSAGKSAISKLRLLDFDDLFLLSHLLEGATIAATAKQLGLTQPAITQRVRKIERVFEQQILEKAGRHVKLTQDGRAICSKAADALALMRDVARDTVRSEATVATLYSIGIGWLWPALAELSQGEEATLYHMRIETKERLLSLLETGAVDAVLAPLHHSAGAFESLEIAEEDYLFVAAPEIAARVQSLDALKEETLIELDRSFPFLSYLEAATRAHVRFKDVWFLGAVQAMLLATLQGRGIAILPRHVVTPSLGSGKLQVVLPEVPFRSDVYRLLFRADETVRAAMVRLAKKLGELTP